MSDAQQIAERLAEEAVATYLQQRAGFKFRDKDSSCDVIPQALLDAGLRLAVEEMEKGSGGDTDAEYPCSSCERALAALKGAKA